MSLIFEQSAPAREADHNRADVACFIGYVARRRGVALPAPVREQLAAAGWVNGLWARPAAQVERLENLPVTIDGWGLFDHLFDWSARPLDGAGRRACAGYLGAAVRAFFAHGGRRAIVIRVGDPWPLLESGTRRAAKRRQRLRRLLPDFADTGAPEHPFTPFDPANWQGIQHLYGLGDCGMVLLPDLADACAVDPPIPDLAPTPPPPPEGFVECGVDEPLQADTSLRHTPAPRLDNSGYAAWKLALDAARNFLGRHRRETLLLASPPLPHVDASRISGGKRRHAQTDMLAWLRRAGVLNDNTSDGRPAEALVQLAWPWLRTRNAADLPESLEAPEGILAGLIADGAIQRGCHRSVAGDFSLARLRDVVDGEPVPAWGLDETSPAAMLARRVCLFAPQPGGWALQSDVTTAAAGATRFGGASRLIAHLLRACRAVGETVVFEGNDEATWARLRRGLEDVLLRYWDAGAFSGATPGEAFSVRCDRHTMTRNDLDNGRLIAQIMVWPAMSIERITVALNLGNAAESPNMREAA